MTIPARVHYRPALFTYERCGTCDYFSNGRCTMFDNTTVNAGFICDEWEGDKMSDVVGTQQSSAYQLPPSLSTMFNQVAPQFTISKEDVSAAGICVRAQDTGRVLMIQRSNDPADKAAGTWEFPGGVLNDGEHPYVGAKREWQEEMGMRLPRGKHGGGWRSGIYQGHIHDIPNESAIKLNLNPEDRKVRNPDDPDGDNVETAAWFAPDHLRRMSSLRPELRAARPWQKVAKEYSWQEIIKKKLKEDEDDDELEKDLAPGPAGDIPPDQGVDDFGGMPSKLTLDAIGPAISGVGPTISSVHVPSPLKNISVSYAGGKKKLKVAKADQKKQLIYGVVLEPNSLDSQDDFMLPDQVEKAAHTYMKKVVRGKASVSKLQHRTQGFFKGKASVVPVQSFIAPIDFSYDGKEMVKKGTWVMCLHVEDQNVWDDVMNNKYTGLSIGGTGIRQSMNFQDRQDMTDEPSDWFKKEASPADFAQWRDFSWEGS